MILVLLASAIGYQWASHKILTVRMPNSTLELFPNDSYRYYLNDAEMLPGGLGGLYAPTGEDPQMIFVFDVPLKINSLRIAFKQPLETDTVIEVYSASENESFEKSDSIKAKSDVYTADIPAGESSALRIDINGIVTIDHIEVSDQSLEIAFPWAIHVANLFLSCILASVFTLIWLLVKRFSTSEYSFLNGDSNTRLLWKNESILSILFLGIVLRFMVMALGYNYDFESYCIVGEIAGNCRNVYAETSRYNYGPIFFILQGLLYRISLIAGENWKDLYRILIVSILTFTDLGITVFIARRYSEKAALLFFLNPISVYISGNHNQFDNMAVLFGLLTIPCFNGATEWNRKDIGFVVFLTLSLITKHILFFVPVFLLLSSKLSIKKKLLYAFAPPALFLLSFIPFMIGNGTAFEGVMNNVFLYRSKNNSPLFHALYEHLGLSGGISFFVFLACMLIVSFVVRKQNYDIALLIYLISLVCFSSAIVNQYLAIPMVALFVLCSGGWKYIYIIALSSFLLSNIDRLWMYILPADGFYKRLHGWIITNSFSIAAWLLLIILVRIAIMGKKKKSVFDPSVKLFADR